MDWSGGFRRKGPRRPANSKRREKHSSSCLPRGVVTRDLASCRKCRKSSSGRPRRSTAYILASRVGGRRSLHSAIRTLQCTDLPSARADLRAHRKPSRLGDSPGSGVVHLSKCRVGQQSGDPLELHAEWFRDVSACENRWFSARWCIRCRRGFCLRSLPDLSTLAPSRGGKFLSSDHPSLSLHAC